MVLEYPNKNRFKQYTEVLKQFVNNIKYENYSFHMSNGSSACPRATKQGLRQAKSGPSPCLRSRHRKQLQRKAADKKKVEWKLKEGEKSMTN